MSPQFEGMIEVRIQAFDEPDLMRYSGLAALYYSPEADGNVRLGLGYNWGGASSDLYDPSHDESGLFFNVTGAF